MHPFVFHNDRLLPLGEVRLSPGQAGLFNGWGLFSTLRTYEGIPFAFERHWERLARDAERTQISLPQGPDAVRRAIQQLLTANRVAAGCIRIYFIANKATIWHSEEALPAVDLIIYSSDLPVRSGPARLTLMPHGRHAANPLSGCKVTAWLNNVWHAEQAHRQGFDDAILLNERGEVAECTAANLFCVRNQAVITPPSSSGCLRGVSREILLEIAPAVGIKIAERAISVSDLRGADELFISSTTRGVQPVGRIADQEFAGVPGPLTHRLAGLFSDYARDYVKREQQRLAG